MPVQTSVAVPALGEPGMLYDNANNDVITRLATEAIPFGAQVVITDSGCSLPAAGTDITGKNVGVALKTHSVPSGGSAYGPSGYEPGKPVAILRGGRVWVSTEDAVTAGGAVNVRYAGTGSKGAVRGAAVSNETAVHQTAKFWVGNAAPGLAVLQLGGV